MSIDTKEKRANVIGVGRPWMRDKFPVATPDEEWRISSGNAYGGNALSPGVGVGTFNELTVHESAMNYLDDNFSLTGSTEYDGEQLDIDSLTEAVQFDLDKYDDSVARKLNKREIDVTARLKVWVKRGTSHYRIFDICNELDTLFNQVTIAVRDYDVSGDPRVGWLRFDEPEIKDQSPPDTNIDCYLLTFQGYAQEE